MSEELTVESRIAPPALSCPKCNGLLPNETKWLLTFLNFEKGCFLGQEPVSRVNFRGRPRRKLITNESGVQEFIKI